MLATIQQNGKGFRRRTLRETREENHATIRRVTAGKMIRGARKTPLVTDDSHVILAYFAIRCRVPIVPPASI
jgi:hypothetical protein